MHRSLLADPIEPADALLEAHGVPGQIEVHDEAAPGLEIETMRRGVGGEQEVGRAPGERGDRGGSRSPVHPAVDDHDTRALAEKTGHVREGVAVFGEDDGRFARAAKEANQRMRLCVVTDRGAREFDEPLEDPLLGARIRQPRSGEDVPGLFVGDISALVVAERERQLGRGRLVRAPEPTRSPPEGCQQRPGARRRALAEHDHGQPGAGTRSIGFGGLPHPGGIALEKRVHPSLDGREADGKNVAPPRHRAAKARPGSAEHQQRTFSRQPPNPAQRLERARLSRMGRGGHQDDACRAAREPVDGCRPLGSQRAEMCLVHHEQVPAQRPHALQHFGLFHEVNRRNRNRHLLPRAVAGQRRPHASPQRCEVREFRLKPKAVRELVLPLGAKAGRAQDQRPDRVGPGAQVGENQASLDGLAEPHFVGQQQAHGSPGARQRGFELVLEQIDAGTRGSANAVEIAVRREQSTQAEDPTAAPHVPGSGRAHDEPRPVERQQQCPAGPEIRCGRSHQPAQRAVLVLDRLGDAPAIAPDIDEGTNAGSWRFLRHHVEPQSQFPQRGR